MAQVVKQEGTTSYASAQTNWVHVLRNEVVLVNDDAATYLLAVMIVDPVDGVSKVAFTDATGQTPTRDLTFSEEDTTGEASAVNQATGIAAVALTNTRVGDTAESAAASDTATSGLNGLFKRLLQRVTVLIAALPTLVLGRSLTEPLGQPSVARQQAVTTLSASVALTATCRRVSIMAQTCDMRYMVGTGTQTANASTSHFLAAGERLDLAVPANGEIGVVRESAATADGTLEVTELA